LNGTSGSGLRWGFAYVYLDGIVLKRSWGSEVKNVSVLVANGVDQEGFRRILGVAEGHKKDKTGWLGVSLYVLVNTAPGPDQRQTRADRAR